MIIHSHKKHISLQILHWTRNDVVVQCSFTRVCQGVPNKMLWERYTNRDVSSFQTRDLYCNGRNMYVQLSHLLCVLGMFRWYVVLDKFVSYSRRQWTSFFHNFKLELYSFCEPCPYTYTAVRQLRRCWAAQFLHIVSAMWGATQCSHSINI